MNVVNSKTKLKEDFDYVFVASVLNKKSLDGVFSIDHEIIFDLEDAIEFKDQQRLNEYIIMMEYSKKDFPHLIEKINLIIEEIITLLNFLKKSFVKNIL